MGEERLQHFGGNWRLTLASYNAGSPGIDFLYDKYGSEWEAHLEEIPRDTPEQSKSAGATVRKYLANTIDRVTTESYSPVPTQGEEPVEDILADVPQYYPRYHRDYLDALSTASRLRAEYEAKPSVIESLKNLTKTDDKAELIMVSQVKSLRAPATAISVIGERIPLIGSIFKRFTGKLAAATVEETKEIDTAKKQELTDVKEVLRAEAWAKLVTELPAYLASKRVTNEQQLIEIYGIEASGGILTAEDESRALDFFHKLEYIIPSTNPATVQELNAALMKPARATPVGLHLLTDLQILDALTQQYVPNSPYGLTQDETIDLYRKAGMSDEEVQEEITRLEPSVTQAITGWQKLYNSYALYKSGLDTPTLPGLTITQWVKMAIQQPWAFALEVMQPLQKYYYEPAAGWAAMQRTEMFTPPGSEQRYGFFGSISQKRKTEMDALYAKAKQEGMGWWMAYGYAWNNSDTNWATKFMTETIIDPLNYIDLGLGMAAKSKTVMKIPVIGKLVPSVNNAWMKGGQCTI